MTKYLLILQISTTLLLPRRATPLRRDCSNSRCNSRHLLPGPLPTWSRTNLQTCPSRLLCSFRQEMCNRRLTGPPQGSITGNLLKIYLAIITEKVKILMLGVAVVAARPAWAAMNLPRQVPHLPTHRPHLPAGASSGARPATGYSRCCKNRYKNFF